MLQALAACLTAGLANIAAARGVKLTEVRSTVTGDIDLNGILGLSPDARNGYQQITMRFTIKDDARPKRCASSWSSREPAQRLPTQDLSGHVQVIGRVPVHSVPRRWTSMW